MAALLWNMSREKVDMSVDCIVLDQDDSYVKLVNFVGSYFLRWTRHFKLIFP